MLYTFTSARLAKVFRVIQTLRDRMHTKVMAQCLPRLRMPRRIRKKKVEGLIIQMCIRDSHGGYEFAKQFYEDAYQAAVQIVGGEQYIFSAVMHADEINRAMTEALGREVYHLSLIHI